MTKLTVKTACSFANDLTFSAKYFDGKICIFRGVSLRYTGSGTRIAFADQPEKNGAWIMLTPSEFIESQFYFNR